MQGRSGGAMLSLLQGPGGALSSAWAMDNGSNRFGLELKRCNAPIITNKQRLDPTTFDLDDGISSTVRYQAFYTAAGDIFRAWEFLDRTAECRNGCVSMGGSYAGECFPLRFAEFAFGPSCPGLRVAIELEHLGHACCLRQCTILAVDRPIAKTRPRNNLSS